MATIWEKVDFNPYERQSYTKYELSHMVIKKREELGLTVEELSKKFEIQLDILRAIEEAKRSFNVPMYRACSKILGMSIDEILKKDAEKVQDVSYRKASSKTNECVNETVELANCIFHEMVMQHKFNVKS